MTQNKRARCLFETLERPLEFTDFKMVWRAGVPTGFDCRKTDADGCKRVRGILALADRADPASRSTSPSSFTVEGIRALPFQKAAWAAA